MAQERNRFLYKGAATTIKAIQNHLRSLDRHGGTYALVFEPPSKGSCVWLIGPESFDSGARRQSRTPGGQLRSVASDFRKSLNVDVRARNRLPKRRSVPGADPAAPVGPPPENDTATSDLKDLRHAVIPDPLMRRIEVTARRLLILPVADLSAVPFSALPATRPGKHLVDYVSALLLPSVDGLFFWVKMPRFKDFENAVIVGDPDLSEDPYYEFIPQPGARDEASAVARLTNAEALTGRNAKFDSVLNSLRRLRPQLIYLATHGIADSENPMDASFLALRGEHLYARQIKKLSFHSDHPLVVMSACQTGLGKTFSAGIFGLARAWIYAGSAQVLASQWNVSDEATADLMKAYMKKMSKGKSSHRAFRDAILATRSRYKDPALWGSFNLFGYAQPQR